MTRRTSVSDTFAAIRLGRDHEWDTEQEGGNDDEQPDLYNGKVVQSQVNWIASRW